MLQSLLAERFHLETHRESRPLSAYELTVGPRGAKLDEAKEANSRNGISSTGGEVNANGVSMLFFAGVHSGYLKYPVLDKTDLKGKFDFKLRYDPSDSGAGPSIFTPSKSSSVFNSVPPKRRSKPSLSIARTVRLPRISHLLR